MPRDFEVGDNPFALTAEEIKSLEPGYKKPKNKVIIGFVFCLNFNAKSKEIEMIGCDRLFPVKPIQWITEPSTLLAGYYRKEV